MPSPRLQVVSSDATPEQVAAIVAAVSLLTRPGGVPAASPDDTLHEWVHASRLVSRRAALQRGPWRMSGRIARRSRA